MAFLTVKEKNIENEGGSNYVTTSGIYDMLLKHAVVDNTKNGAVQINYLFDRCQSYGNTIIKTDGQPSFGFQILEALTAVIGEDELSDPEMTTVQFKKSAKELSCLPELTDVQVKVWIQFGYRMWNNEIREDVVVKRFYRSADNANGSEVLKQTNGETVVIGERYDKDVDFSTEVKYEDGVTPDAVAAWKKAKAAEAKGGATPPNPAASTGGFPAKGAGFPTPSK